MKPHFKVHTSISGHRKTVELFGDNQLLATWVRIGLRFIDRFGDRTNNEIQVRDVDLPALTGMSSIEESRKVLRLVSKLSPLQARWSGKTITLIFPNFAKKQGFGPRDGEKKGTRREEESAPPATATATATKDYTSESPEPDSDRSGRRTKAPDALNPSDHVRVRSWYAYCFPGPKSDVAELAIEEALGFFRMDGRRYSHWGLAAINNIRTRRRNEQRRDDPSYQVRSLEEAKRLHRDTGCSTRALAEVGVLIDKYKANLASKDTKFKIPRDEMIDIRNAQEKLGSR